MTKSKEDTTHNIEDTIIKLCIRLNDIDTEFAELDSDNLTGYYDAVEFEDTEYSYKGSIAEMYYELVRIRCSINQLKEIAYRDLEAVRNGVTND